MCYREDHPHTPEWPQGLPADADPALKREHGRALASSPFVNCKRGDEIEIGDSIQMGSGTFLTVTILGGWEVESLGGSRRKVTGYWGGSIRDLTIFAEEFYQLTSVSYETR